MIEFWQHILYTFLFAMTPIAELRGSIPVAISVFHLPVAYAFIASVLGNLVPVIPILLGLEGLSRLLEKHWKFGRQLLEKILNRSKKHSDIVKKYGFWGLIILVAIPLPGTGAWTGSFVAFLLGLDRRRAFMAIAWGVLIAGVLVTLATLGVIGVVKVTG